MSRAIWALLWAVLSLWAQEWDHYDTFRLQKDQWQHVRIHTKHRSHELAFRWTLYQGGGLVMHVRYDAHRYQPLLYRDARRDTFRLPLFARQDEASPLPLGRPYALLIFREFDPRRREAVIDMRLKTHGETEVYYVKGK